MANNVYKTLGANAQTLTLLATVCLEDPVAQEKAKTLLDKALTQRPDYIKAVVKKAELLSKSFPLLFSCVQVLFSMNRDVCRCSPHQVLKMVEGSNFHPHLSVL